MKNKNFRNARPTSNIIGKQIQKGFKWQPQSKQTLTLAFIRMKKGFFSMNNLTELLMQLQVEMLKDLKF